MRVIYFTVTSVFLMTLFEVIDTFLFYGKDYYQLLEILKLTKNFRHNFAGTYQTPLILVRFYVTITSPRGILFTLKTVTSFEKRAQNGAYRWRFQSGNLLSTSEESNQQASKRIEVSNF